LETIQAPESMICTLKLTRAESEALDELVTIHGFASKSEAIRDAMGLLFYEHNISEEGKARLRHARRFIVARGKKIPRPLLDGIYFKNRQELDQVPTGKPAKKVNPAKSEKTATKTKGK